MLGYFEVWLEDVLDVKFLYYCEDFVNGNLLFSNFMYSVSEGWLEFWFYYDLGVVEFY